MPDVSTRESLRHNARISKVLSVPLLGLLAAALLLALDDSYDPAVSTVLLLTVAAVLFTVAATVLLLPAEQFTGSFCAGCYVLYAGLVSVMVFLSGGVSSELYLLYVPLLFAAALHGSWGVAAAVLAAVAGGYFLAVAPELSGAVAADGDPALVLFRLAAFVLAGLFAAYVARNLAEPPEEQGYVMDEDGSMLLGRVSGELEARRGEEVAVLLVDPGRRVEDPELLLERVRTRIGEPVLLGEGNVFGLVLGGVDDRVVESAARRALAAASSLGAEETRAGAAVYPRDARTPEDLLVAAGQALEAAFEVESPSAIVTAGRLRQPRYRAAR